MISTNSAAGNEYQQHRELAGWNHGKTQSRAQLFVFLVIVITIWKKAALILFKSSTFFAKTWSRGSVDKPRGELHEGRCRRCLLASNNKIAIPGLEPALRKMGERGKYSGGAIRQCAVEQSLLSTGTALQEAGTRRSEHY